MRDFVLDLPAGWAECRISDIAEVNPPLDLRPIPAGAEVHFVPMQAVEAETGRVDISRTRPHDEVRKGYTAFVAGDVIFAKITPCMENGKMAVVPELPAGVAFGSTEFHVLRCRAGVASKYLYYFVSGQVFRHEAEHNMTGAVGQKRVPTTFVADHAFSLPPTHEQHRIVTKIEELFSELDNAVESLVLARAQLRTYRQALLKAAFEGKLTADWRAANPDKLEPPETLLARIRAEREACYKQALADWKTALAEWRAGGEIGRKPSKPGALREFRDDFGDVDVTLCDLPMGWGWGRLGFATCGVEYGTSAKSSDVGDVPVVRMGNLQGGAIDWTDLVFTSDKEEIEKYALSPRDVLFNRTNSPELVGKTSIYRGERPAVFAGYLVRVNQIESVLIAEFLSHFMGTHLAKRHGDSVKTDGVNQSNINGNKLQEYPFPFCCVEEQRRVLEILDEKLSVVDRNLSDIEDHFSRIGALRQSILKKAFTGRLVPQDPTDEPAASLLARLREQPTPVRTRRRKAA